MKETVHFRCRKEYCVSRNKLFLLTRGTMQVVRTNIQGKRQGMAYLGEGDILNLTSLFNTAENRDDICIYTFTECETCVFALQDLYNENSLSYLDIVLAILKNTTRRLSQVIQILNSVSLDGSEDRVMNMLDLILNYDTSDYVQKKSPAVPHSHEELSTFFGLNRVTTTRAIDNLQKKGLLSAERRSIKKV